MNPDERRHTQLIAAIDRLVGAVNSLVGAVNSMEENLGWLFIALLFVGVSSCVGGR